MAKKTVIENPAFKKKSTDVQTKPVDSFNLINKSNNFTSVFDHKPLDNGEQQTIKNLLTSGTREKRKRNNCNTDVSELINITAEIKSITKQGVILIGERIWKARKILKAYREGTFSKWLETTFGNKKTGYNILSYYDLYQQLPSKDIQHKLNKMPKSAAYILASRQAEINQKIDVINHCCDLKYKEIIDLIKDQFTVYDKRVIKSKDQLFKILLATVNSIEKNSLVLTRKEYISLKTAYETLGALMKKFA